MSELPTTEPDKMQLSPEYRLALTASKVLVSHYKHFTPSYLTPINTTKSSAKTIREEKTTSHTLGADSEKLSCNVNIDPGFKEADSSSSTLHEGFSVPSLKSFSGIKPCLHLDRIFQFFFLSA